MKDGQWYWGNGVKIDHKDIHDVNNNKAYPYLIWHENIPGGITKTTSNSVMHMMIMWDRDQ